MKRTQLSEFVISLAVLLGLVGLCVAQPGPPSIAQGGVVNAAKYTPELAPGTMASVFGTNLAAGFAASTSRVLPTSIGGSSVEVTGADGRAALAPVYFVSPGQINFQMPFGLRAGAAQVRVRTAQGVSGAAAVAIQAAAPAFFTVDASGTGEALVLHAADYSVVNGARPAAAGQYLVLMATGLGEVTPAAVAGRPGGDTGEWGPLNWHVAKPEVWIGGRAAPLLFWGLMPGFAGVSQLNVQVPADLPPGLHPIEILAAGAASQTAIGIPVARPAPVLSSGLVTAAGGTVSSGGFSVAIPAGLYNAPTVVSVTGSGGERPPGTGRISDVHGVRGLPAQLSQPVTITIPLQQAPPPGSEPQAAMNTGPGVQGTGVTFLDATVVGNSVRVILPAYDDDARVPPPAGALLAAAGNGEVTAESAGPEVSFWVMTFSRRVNSAGGHFMIFYPAGDAALEAKVPAIGQQLEEAYTKIAALGLDWSKRKRWPLRVIIQPLEGDHKDAWGLAEPSTLGRDYWSISLNSHKLQGAGVSDSFRATIGHELLHVMQDLYDPRSAYRIAKFPSPWLWYWEASSTWFESVILGDPSYIPGTVSDENFTFPTKRGLNYPPGEKGAVQSHGYGASMFLQQLLKTRPHTTVGDTIKQASTRAQGILAESLYSPVQAMNSLYGSLGVKWVEFIENYAEGKIYGKVFPSVEQILGLRSNNYYDFKQDTDTGTTFTWQSANLSARVMVIRFQQSWPDNTQVTLSFEAGGDLVTAFLYRISSKGWTKVGSFTKSHTLDNAEQFAKNNEQLLVVVGDGSGTGKYTGSNETRLRVQKGGNLLAFLQKKTKLNHKLYGTITCSGGGGGSMIGTFFSKGPIQWNGASFRVETQDSDLVSAGDPPYELTITGTLSEDGTTLKSLQYRRYRKIDRTFKDAAGTEFYSYDERLNSWTVSNAPLWDTVERVLQGKALARFQLKDAAGAAGVSSFVYEAKYWFGSPKDFRPEAITRNTCTIAISGDGVVLDFSN